MDLLWHLLEAAAPLNAESCSDTVIVGYTNYVEFVLLHVLDSKKVPQGENILKLLCVI